MNRQRKIINRLCHQFKNDFFPITTKLDQDKVNEFQLSEFGTNSILSDIDFNNWLYSTPISNERVFCLSGDEIVGQQSALQSRLSIDGESIDCVCAINLIVKEEWRMKGLGVALTGDLINNHTLVVCLGVSDVAFRMFIRQGWSDMGKTNCYIKPMKLKFVNDNTPFTNLYKNFRLTLALALSKIIDFRYRIFSEQPSLNRVKNKADLDPNILINNHQSNKIRFKRSLKYLAWRYFDIPSYRPYLLYTVNYKNKQLPGYLVVKISDYENKKALVISDIEAHTQDMGQFIDAIVILATQKKTDIILYNGFNLALEKILSTRQFYQRPNGDIFVYYCNDDNIANDLSKKENWIIKFSDSDMDFSYY